MNTLKYVGIRDLREHLAQHLMSATPFAVTKHGLTLGYFIPVHQTVTRQQKQALQDASEHLQALLERDGLDPDVLISDATNIESRSTNTVRDPQAST